MCNGSTSDSGSDCGGSNPPWGTKAESEMVQLFFGSLEYRFSSSPSQGGETGSTPVGAMRRTILKKTRFDESFFFNIDFIGLFFNYYLEE